jgi:hypothetical protein
MTSFGLKLKIVREEFKEDWTNANVKNLLLKFLKAEIWLFSYLFLNRRIIDFENRSIVRFVKEASGRLPTAACVLDAGAGDKPYAGYFRHSQ